MPNNIKADDPLSNHLRTQDASTSKLRHVEQGLPPWPSPHGTDSAMLHFLIEQSREIAETDGMDGALLWVAVHSWFEGGIAAADRAVKKRSGRTAYDVMEEELMAQHFGITPATAKKLDELRAERAGEDE